MIDAKRLAEMMEPGKLRKLADAFDAYRTSARPVLTHADLDDVTAVLREVAKEKSSQTHIRDVLPGSDDDVTDSRDELIDALALGVATLLRRADADRTADCLCNFGDMFRVARKRHAEGLAEVAAEMKP